MIDHAKNASKFLKDPDRVYRHDHALRYIRLKRDQAAKAVPEWEELRLQAQRIKSHTLEHLGFYLDLFEKRAKANGIEVLWAEDAAEFRRIVADILKQHGARRVVKSKSMLTEECGLNPYLESERIEVTDTDLGERIVQLAHEPPSHIVLPAIHLSKEEVAAIFAKELGSDPAKADPYYLTQVAREHLRRKFLEADAAITGVNFALAKEGGFVVCTNEGNADLGAALPNLHIACMGLEKIIPSAKELGVFIRLLARSATGQAITTYTSHFLGPKAGGKLYIVIVDNGRSRLLRGKEYKLLSCIRCGACMNSCPVYRRSGGHSYASVVPGPIGSALAAAKDARYYASLPFACTLCGSCDMVCPVKIDLHRHLYRERKGAIRAKEFRRKVIGLKVAAFVLRHPRVHQMLMAISRWLLPYMPRSILYNRFNLWGREHEMPIPAKRSFRSYYKNLRRDRER